MGSNAPEALLCKDSGKRSADFCAAVRRKSNGIFQAVGKVQGLFRQPEAGTPYRSARLSLSKNSVEKNPLKLGRGSSRGRQPASSGIECPECLAWQGVQRAQRGLFRRIAAGKYRHFCCLGWKTGRPGVPPLRKYKSLSGERRRGRRPRRPAGAHYAVLRFKRIALIIRTVPLIRHAARATFP